MKIKFELKPYNRNISKEDLLVDLRNVATKLGKKSLSTEEYGKHGRVNVSTIGHRFGSWNKAVEQAGLQIRKRNKCSNEELLLDLKRVVKIVGKNSLTREEYKSYGIYGLNTFRRAFGSWYGAQKLVGLQKAHQYKITNEEYFKNLEEVWTKLGRQPYYGEVTKPLSKYTSKGYAHRFGSWRKALEAFVNFMNNENDESSSQEVSSVDVIEINTPDTGLHKTKRNVNWRLRFIVMKRDNFKCLKCGRSPSTDPSVILHVDHKKPYSKGGETVLGNLETLCMVCNIGKSDLE